MPNIPKETLPDEENIVVEPEPASKKKKFCKVQNVDIKQIILNHIYGPAFLSAYGVTKELNSAGQTYVVEVVVTHLISTFGL